MPNWCQNSILIPLEKKKDFIRKFTRQVKPQSAWGLKSHWLDFNRLTPMPVAEKANWYSWRCDNWGTKWNAGHTQFHKHKDGYGQATKLFAATDPVLEITFDTAWNPASEQILTLMAKRLQCDVEHAGLEEAMGINFICTYEHAHDGCEPYIERDEFTGDYDQDEYRKILERFYGDADMVEESMQCRFGSDDEDFDLDEDQAA